MKKFRIKYKEKSFIYEIFTEAKTPAEVLEWFVNNMPHKARILEIKEVFDK